MLPGFKFQNTYAVSRYKTAIIINQITRLFSLSY